MVVIERELSDVGRETTYAFIRAQLGDSSVYPLIATDAPVPSIVFSARETDKIVGGIYVGPDFETMSESQSPGLDSATRRRGWQTIWALHGIAVDPSRRREGIAALLLAKAEAIALDEGAELITGVSIAGHVADDFYRSRNYQVGPRQWPLVFRFDSDVKVLIRQDEPDARWFWKRLQEGGASAFSPSQKQLELFERGAANG